MTTNESDARRAARDTGIRLAARIATAGGIVIAAAGIAASATAATPRGEAVHLSDDAAPLPLEALRVPASKGCGCAPCWGPPSPPPARGGAARARAARRKSGTRPRRARRPR